jgi:mono/diheme cytochrome c family protein
MQETVPLVGASVVSGYGKFGERILITYKIAMVFCVAGFTFTAVFAQTPATDKGLTANPAFTKNCAGCHGKAAEGRHFAGPSLVSEKAAAASEDDLRNIITNGKGRMPKYSSKLTAEEINTLVQQIRALNRKRGAG